MPTPSNHTLAPTNTRPIAIWLFICCALVFAMIVLGGVTRLTGSGLSMVDWKPIMGILPPLNETQWQAAFAQYQQFPEYRHININMDVAGFKSIFVLEYAHRLLGRSIGIVFLLPFLFFWWRGYFTRSLIPKLITMFVLGGLQGLLGWYMVQSGLVDNPHVSQYRLTAHLLLALLVYAYMFWVALDLLTDKSATTAHPLRPFALVILGLLSLTVLSGGFVAGLKAGLSFNTFPLMEGHWIPAGYWNAQLGWKNFFENAATVQWDHRFLAISSFTLIVLFWGVGQRKTLPTGVRWGLHLFLLMALTQVALGISTLLLRVPVPLASAHQAGAVVLFSIALFLSHQLAYTHPSNTTTLRPATA